jgi:5'(3')-deoxyribonucleotidase
MKKKIIAVDIDDVLADSAAHFVNFSNQNWGTSLHVDDYTEHWAEMWGIDQEEMQSRANVIYESKMQLKVSHFSDAHSVLKYLSKDYKLVITTSRHRLVQQDTVEWLNKNFEGIFEDIHFAGIWDAGHHSDHAINLTKADLHKEIGADYVIDDHPKHCLAAAEKGITSLLFGDYSWNRGVRSTKNMIKVKGWAEVKDFFDGERKQLQG